MCLFLSPLTMASATDIAFQPNNLLCILEELAKLIPEKELSDWLVLHKVGTRSLPRTGCKDPRLQREVS